MLIQLILILFFNSSAFSQTVTPSTQGVTNEEVIKRWKQQNPTAQTPTLVAQEDGTTKVEWSGSIAGDIYSNQVSSQNPSVNTPLQDGTFHRVIITGDVKRTKSTGSVDYFQMNMTESDDKNVNSRKKVQINNLQMGHIGETYAIYAGDIVPNFSSLSSSLVARGGMGEKNIGKTSVTAYLGTISDSWESLWETSLRSRYLRDAYGVKFGHDVSSEFKIYGTQQAGKDRKSSWSESSIGASQLSATTAGFTYLKDQFLINGEFGKSKSELQNVDSYNGTAILADSSWSRDNISTHFGYHDLDENYASLSGAAQPGVKEAYIGGDWKTTEFLTLGADFRNTKNYEIPSGNIANKTNSRNLRATTNLGSEAFSLSLQNYYSLSKITAGGGKIRQINRLLVSITIFKSGWHR